MRRAIGIVLLLLIVIVSLGSGTWFSSHCAPHQPSESREQNQATEENCATLDGIIFRSAATGMKAVGEAFHAYHDDVNAFATVFIAIFTIVLGIFTVSLSRSTRIAANAAKQATDALPVVERAYVYPVIISAGGTGECIREALVFYEGDITKDDTPIPTTAEITFRIKNYGKTPAILKSAYAGFGVNPIGAELGLSIPESILGEMETTSELTSKMQAGPTRTQAQNIRVYTASMGFNGQITFDDIWGNEHTTRFLFVWDQEIQRMALRYVETTTKSD
jgi:hypothetical protein